MSEHKKDHESKPSLAHNGKTFTVEDPSDPKSFAKTVSNFINSLESEVVTNVGGKPRTNPDKTDQTAKIPMNMKDSVFISGDWSGKGAESLDDLINSGAKVALDKGFRADDDDKTENHILEVDKHREECKKRGVAVPHYEFPAIVQTSGNDLENDDIYDSSKPAHSSPSHDESLEVKAPKRPKGEYVAEDDVSSPKKPAATTAEPTSKTTAASTSKTDTANQTSASAPASAPKEFQTKIFKVEKKDYVATANKTLDFLKKEKIDPTTATAKPRGDGWTGPAGHEAIEKLIRAGVQVNFNDYKPTPALEALNKDAQAVRQKMQDMQARGETPRSFSQMLNEHLGKAKQPAAKPTSTQPAVAKPASSAPTRPAAAKPVTSAPARPAAAKPASNSAPAQRPEAKQAGAEAKAPRTESKPLTNNPQWLNRPGSQAPAATASNSASDVGSAATNLLGEVISGLMNL